MEHVEIEFKVMINKNDFLLLENKLANKSFCHYTQTNHYYETDDFKLKSNHLSLRIRNIENENKFVLTLKEKLKEGKLEHEYEVKENSILCFPDEIIRILKKHNIIIDKIKEIASLKTIRKEFKDGENVLCLDHSFYYGKEDYEIECESSSMSKAMLYISDLLDKYNIKYTISNKTKIARAMENRC